MLSRVWQAGIMTTLLERALEKVQSLDRDEQDAKAAQIPDSPHSGNGCANWRGKLLTKTSVAAGKGRPHRSQFPPAARE